jgi:hypothetical protein
MGEVVGVLFMHVTEGDDDVMAKKRKKRGRKAIINRFLRRFGESAGNRAAHIYAHSRSIAGKKAVRRKTLARQIAMHSETGGRAYNYHIPGQESRRKHLQDVKARRAAGKRPYASKKAHSRSNRSAAMKKAWATRKRKYGSSGKGKRGSQRKR